jgi:general secretion pathway protein G
MTVPLDLDAPSVAPGPFSKPHPRSTVNSTLNLKSTSQSKPGGRTRSRGRHGFTLIEILVVIAVISLLAALVAPNVFRHVGTAKDASAKTQIEMLGAALDAYRLDNGRYPSTAQGLEALWEAPTAEPRPSNWRGPYLRKEVPADPWGNPYIYVSPGEEHESGYDLVTYGADGEPGGEGENVDISN